MSTFNTKTQIDTFESQGLGQKHVAHSEFVENKTTEFASAQPSMFETVSTTSTIKKMPEVVTERIIDESVSAPQVMEVKERDVFVQPQVHVTDRVEEQVEIEKEITHVHPVRIEKEIVYVHPTTIEKEVTHVQPRIVKVHETVVHPEKVIHQVEERVLAPTISAEKEIDVLPEVIENKEVVVNSTSIGMEREQEERVISGVKNLSLNSTATERDITTSSFDAPSGEVLTETITQVESVDFGQSSLHQRAPTTETHAYVGSARPLYREEEFGRVSDAYVEPVDPYNERGHVVHTEKKKEGLLHKLFHHHHNKDKHDTYRY